MCPEDHLFVLSCPLQKQETRKYFVRARYKLRLLVIKLATCTCILQDSLSPHHKQQHSLLHTGTELFNNYSICHFIACANSKETGHLQCNPHTAVLQETRKLSRILLFDSHPAKAFSTKLRVICLAFHESFSAKCSLSLLKISPLWYAMLTASCQGPTYEVNLFRSSKWCSLLGCH